MKDNWSDPKFTGNWDTYTVAGNPSRPVQLDLLTTIIADHYKSGDKILDLGFGSGQIEQILLAKIPTAQIVGVDSSEVMIAKAKDKLTSVFDNVITILHNLEDISSLKLPDQSYKFVITSQVLHEIPSEKKKAIFKFVFDHLPSGGMYLLLDKVLVDYKALIAPLTSMWNWQERIAELKSNKPFESYVEAMGSKEDFPDTLANQLLWMQEAGFKGGCLHMHLDRALIAGVKP
jgi:ubiquinone/menaquinone biosynthesis C-methylase UbiE